MRELCSYWGQRQFFISRQETSVARIEGVNIPTEKVVGIALTYVYGIGRTSAKKI